MIPFRVRVRVRVSESGMIPFQSQLNSNAEDLLTVDGDETEGLGSKAAPNEHPPRFLSMR